MRYAPAITVIEELLNHGAKIIAYNPKAIETAKLYFGDKISYCKNAYECLENADCLLLMTEWNEFRRPDFEKMKLLMISPIIFDARNQYDSERLKEKGFDYTCIGK